MAIDIDKYRSQQKQSAAETVKNLREGYAFISLLTNLPYVECEEVDYNDQIHLFEKKEDAESMQKELEEQGNRVRILELKTVEVQVPVNPKEPDGEKKTMYLSQVRQHLGILPFIGVNAVCFYPAEGASVCIELKDVLPEDFEKKISENPLYQPNVQLTGIYLMQEARKKKELVDQKRLRELDEEFSANLANCKVFLGALPPAGKENDPKLELRECKLPYLKYQNGNNFFPVFTDVWEFQKYAKGKKNLRSIQIPFKDITKFWVEDAKAYMVNPHGIALPLSKDVIPNMVKRFGKE